MAVYELELIAEDVVYIGSGKPNSTTPF